MVDRVAQSRHFHVLRTHPRNVARPEFGDRLAGGATTEPRADVAEWRFGKGRLEVGMFMDDWRQRSAAGLCVLSLAACSSSQTGENDGSVAMSDEAILRAL